MLKKLIKVLKINSSSVVGNGNVFINSKFGTENNVINVVKRTTSV